MPPAYTLRCPSCRRSNTIAPDRPEAARCTRCECELEALALIQELATVHVQEACTALASGNLTAALHLAEEAHALHHTPTTDACLFLARIQQPVKS